VKKHGVFYGVYTKFYVVKSVEIKITDAEVKEGEKNDDVCAAGDYKQHIDYGGPVRFLGRGLPDGPS